VQAALVLDASRRVETADAEIQDRQARVSELEAELQEERARGQV
jgi:hypothetical protein